MTRKHFEMIAGILSDEKKLWKNGEFEDDVAQLVLDGLAIKFSEKLAATNPNFDRARFLTAAGLPTVEPL